MTPPVVPLWKAIADQIATDIDSGKLQAGARLSSEVELESRHRVSRPTVVHALRHLRTTGYVHRRQGIGTFVSDRRGSSGPTVRIRSHTLTTELVIQRETTSTMHILVMADGCAAGNVTIEFSPVIWRLSEDIARWDVLEGSSGWADATRTVCITSVLSPRPTPGALLSIVTTVADRSLDRSCTISMTLNSALFWVEHLEANAVATPKQT